MKSMSKLIVAFFGLLTFLAIGSFPARAEWKDMNKAINETNFIVRDGCSGTLISVKHRVIITAHHCIDEFVDTQQKEETQEDGTVKKVKREILLDVPVKQKAYKGFRLVGDAQYMTQIVAHKRTSDLALLQIRADINQTIFSHVLPASKTAERGDRIFVVGNPLGFLDASLSSGVISSTTRMLRVPWADEAEVPFFQVDAAINGGNSGGALYNDMGELIGIPDAGWSGYTGLGLTLTTDSMRDFLKENCFAELYDDKAPDYDACTAEKKAKAEKKKKAREAKED